MKTRAPATDNAQQTTLISAQPSLRVAQAQSIVEDSRPEAAIAQGMRVMAQASPRTAQLQHLQARMDTAARANHTGLPDTLKSGVEHLSGMSMDHVKVHYNSDKPAQLHAHAYAQGSDIHVGPGQEHHLPHESWHVVQQAQGRVRPTRQLKGNVSVNDDASLEREADVMGAQAMSAGQSNSLATSAPGTANQLASTAIPVQRVVQRAELVTGQLNVAGENHNVSGSRRPDEIAYSTELTGGGYWTEGAFAVADGSNVAADDVNLRVKQLIAFAHGTDEFRNIEPDRMVSALIADPTIVGSFKMAVKLFRPNEIALYAHLVDPDTYAAYSETLLMNAPHFAKCIGIVEDTLQEYKSSPSIGLKATLTEATMLFQMAFDVLAIQVAQVSEELGIISSDQISLQRSEKMHAAANNRAATSGLWKVGEEHAQDMLHMNARNYQLLPKLDFDDGFNLFMARREALEKITTIANGNWSPHTKGVRSAPTGVRAINEIIKAGAGQPIALILARIQARAAQDHVRASSYRSQQAIAFYAALSAMNISDAQAMSGTTGQLDNVNL